MLVLGSSRMISFCSRNLCDGVWNKVSTVHGMSKSNVGMEHNIIIGVLKCQSSPVRICGANVVTTYIEHSV